MDWNNLKFFLAVARSNNVTDASTKLKVSPSTVARKISELEESLETTLFTKKTNGYFLTEYGESILSMVEETEAKMDFMSRAITRQKSEKSGKLRLDVPEILGMHVIIPELLKTQENYPGIQFEFSNSVVSRKLANAQSDIIVRLSKPDNGLYTIRRIGMLNQAAYCSSEYAEKRGVPETAEELENHFLIGWNDNMSYLNLAQWLARTSNGAEIWMKTPNLQSQLRAVRSGLGIAALPVILGKRFNLTRVLKRAEPSMSEIWLLRNQETRTSEAVDIVVDAIVNAVEKAQSDLALP